MHAEQFPTKKWWIAFSVALAFLSLLVFALIELFYAGMGIAGVNQPVGWGSFIINFVFWIGIGHAGHADLRGALPVPPAVADGHQPRGRGDDAVRGGLRGHLPGHPPRARRGSPTG